MYRPEEIKLLYTHQGAALRAPLHDRGRAQDALTEREGTTGSRWSMGFKDATRKVTLTEIKEELTKLAVAAARAAA